MQDPLLGFEALGWEDLLLDGVPLQVLPDPLLIIKWHGSELDCIALLGPSSRLAVAAFCGISFSPPFCLASSCQSMLAC